MVHLEYDLVLTNVFTTPVTITAIDVLTWKDSRCSSSREIPSQP